MTTSGDAVDRVIADLEAEHADLAELLVGIDETGWRKKTPAAGWDVADSVSHLHFFDIRAALAITDAGAFARDTGEMMARFAEGGDRNRMFISGGSGYTLNKAALKTLVVECFPECFPHMRTFSEEDRKSTRLNSSHRT